MTRIRCSPCEQTIKRSNPLSVEQNDRFSTTAVQFTVMTDPEKLRENLIRRVVSNLKRGFHSVRADISTSRYERPQLIRSGSNAFRPDITAYSGSELHIYAVETADRIADTSSHDRWTAFARYADEESERTFHLVVPSGSRDHVRLWLRQLSIDAEVMTVAV